MLTFLDSNAHILKLVRSLLNYSVLGTSTATICLSKDHSLYAPIYSPFISYTTRLSQVFSYILER